MSKKQTRRAARQGQPKPVVRDRNSIRGSGARKPRPRAAGRSARGPVARRPLRPPTLKRAAIQGAGLAILYWIVIRFVWRQPGATTATYVIFPLAGFVAYTCITYFIDRFTYQKRLRKQQGPSK
jgi:hypothetical protein